MHVTCVPTRTHTRVPRGGGQGGGVVGRDGEDSASERERERDTRRGEGRLPPEDAGGEEEKGDDGGGWGSAGRGGSHV